MKQLIEQTLGNSLRCILPSYWWKRLLNKMAERVAAAEASAASALRIVSSALNDFSSEINSLSSRISAKQDMLRSGSNIKTINGQSILGSGNLEIKAEGQIEYNYNSIMFHAAIGSNGEDFFTDTKRESNAAMYKVFKNSTSCPVVTVMGYSQYVTNGVLRLNVPVGLVCLQSTYLTEINEDGFAECVALRCMVKGEMWEILILPDGNYKSSQTPKYV